MQTSLKGINKRALSDKTHRFGGLYKLLNLDNLRWAFRQLNKKAKPGHDDVTYDDYEKNLEENLHGLVERLKRKTYKAKLVKRVYIPKPSGKMRPLGLPALEDKLVQLACSRILESIFEADFITQSYGYRRKVGAHHAVKTVRNEAFFGPYKYVVEADIKGFFDNMDHEWIIRMLEQRINDCAFTGLIRKWLKAGILDDSRVLNPETGSPQGGIISPVLANIYLHFALDLWFKKRVKKGCYGKCEIIRYADDFVCFFQKRVDAQAFYEHLPDRLRKFNLEVAPEKTKLLNFSKERFETNETFVFLSFEFRWEISAKGQPYVSVKTAPESLKRKIAEFKVWIKSNRHKNIRLLMSKVKQKLSGHFNYYGVFSNSKRLQMFYFKAIRNLFKWLNRRSQRISFNWSEFNTLIKRFNLPYPKANLLVSNKKQNQKINPQAEFAFMMEI